MSTQSVEGKASDQSGPLMCRGLRGAITVSNDSEGEILEATRELLQALVEANGINVDDVASIYFTTTTDLTSTYPAFAARQLGWFDMALMCGHEMEVPSGLDKCVRVLIHWNTTRTPQELVHVYLRGAKALRPDRSNIPRFAPARCRP
ncbi:MAG: chorismate mutase [Chloroflexota bacterium]